jgi:hypothetical protein
MFDLRSKSTFAGLLAGATVLTGLAIGTEVRANRDNFHGGGHDGGHRVKKHHRKERHHYGFYYEGKQYYCKDYWDKEPSDSKHGYYYYCVSKGHDRHYSSYDEKHHRGRR